jgi:hypothetical protein
MACAAMVIAGVVGEVIAKMDRSILLVNPAVGSQVATFPNEVLHKAIRLGMVLEGLGQVTKFLLAYLISDQGAVGLGHRAESKEWVAIVQTGSVA